MASMVPWGRHKSLLYTTRAPKKIHEVVNQEEDEWKRGAARAMYNLIGQEVRWYTQGVNYRSHEASSAWAETENAATGVCRIHEHEFDKLEKKCNILLLSRRRRLWPWRCSESIEAQRQNCQNQNRRNHKCVFRKFVFRGWQKGSLPSLSQKTRLQPSNVSLDVIWTERLRDSWEKAWEVSEQKSC